jgi:hypothetical protein
MRVMVFVLEGKGGAWKSTIAQTLVLMLGDDGKWMVEVVDCDTTNSLMASAFGKDSIKYVDLGEAEAAGHLSARMKSTADYCVIDVGARDEVRVIDMLPALAKMAAKEKCQIVVFRPITLSTFTQRNAVNFIELSKNLGVKVVMVQTRGQGRTAKHFAPWEASGVRSSALAMGAVETYMTDAGIRWADEIPSFGITFAEVAGGDFSRVKEENRADAEALFDEGLQAHMALRLWDNATRFRQAMVDVGALT